MSNIYKSVPVLPSEITPRSLYENRRDFLKAAGVLTGSALLAACTTTGSSDTNDQAGGVPASAAKFAGKTDELAYIATNGAQTYDAGGVIAADATVHQDLLDRWMSDPYFKKSPPKTTGRELFGAQFAKRIRAESPDVPVEDLVATATALTAESIARAYRDFIEPRGRIDEVLVAGGGANNPTLLAMIGERMPKIALKKYTASDAKEAMAFVAFLLTPEAQDILRNTGQPPVVPALRKGEVPAEVH
jgi:hypothetical protein